MLQDIALKALYFDPEPVAGSSGNPLIVFISSWGMNKWEYVVPAGEYAARGYTVISYTARGFWESGGEIDMAGLKDQADLSRVLDWALAETHADPARIGLSGISYGGGLSLLGAAKDPRVRSVAAMSCWVDLAESFLGNGETIRKEAVRLLEALAEATGKPSAELEEVFDDYFSNSNLGFLYTYTYNSSALNFIDEINANGAAVFMANALGDSLFTPNQFPAFYDRLTGPKHLEFAPGDHAGPELPGLLGLPDQVWARAGEWNDYYLLRGQSGADAALPAIVFNTMNGDEVEGYASWKEVTTDYLAYQFGEGETLVAVDAAATKGMEGGGRDMLASIRAGRSANISGGVAYLSETVEAYTDQQREFPLGSIIRARGAVFVSPPVSAETVRFRGEPELELSFIPFDSDGTLVVYLLGVDEQDVGHLFTFSPWTYKGLSTGREQTLSVQLTMTAYDLPAGYRLAVVLATHDTLYLDQNRFDAQIDFLSASLLRMPVNGAV
jgi:pimeloyl-ACP methyl ester carboxylesterase